MRPPALGPALRGECVEHAALFMPVTRKVNFSAQQVVDQQIALYLVGPLAFQHEDGFQAKFVASPYRLSRGVGLQIEAYDHHVGFLGHGSGQAELKIAQLVAA